MKFRKGLVIGLGLALSLQSVVVFASDVQLGATTTTSAVTGIIEEGTEEATEDAVTEEAVTEEEVTEEAVAEDAVTEEAVTEEAVTEEAVTEEAATEEAVTEDAATEEEVTEEEVTQEEVTEEEVVEEVAVEEIAIVELLVEEVVPEVKANATLLITNKLLCDDGEIVFQEEIKDLVAGSSVDISEYLHENEDIKAVNGSGTIELAEGQNEIIIDYKFVLKSDDEENNNDTVEEEYAGELMR